MTKKRSPQRRAATLGDKGNKSKCHTTNGSPGHTQAAALTAAARAYHDNHHWVPLRLQGKSPECMGEGWRKRKLQEPLPQFKDGDNIGFLLGAPSGGIVRLDPDWSAIPDVTDILFPEPTAIFERASALRYGRVFICPGFKGKNFKLPKFMQDDERLPLLPNGKGKVMVYQILSSGQTMAPPSIHPDAGEELVWVDNCQPVELSANELIRRGRH